MYANGSAEQVISKYVCDCEGMFVLYLNILFSTSLTLLCNYGTVKKKHCLFINI